MSAGARAREALADAMKRQDGPRVLQLVTRLLEITGPGGTHDLLVPRAAPDLPAGISAITSVYEGKCRRCKAPIRPGDALYLREGQPGGICGLCAGVLT